MVAESLKKKVGGQLVANLLNEGIDVSDIGIEPDTRSGLAVITLDQEAENTIVVSPGANSTLTTEEVLASEHLRNAKVVLAQLEVPLEAVMAAANVATGLFCLNAAPARILPTELLENVDILIVNRAELATLTGVMIESIDWVTSTARLIHGPATIVVTLGAEGAVVVEESGTEHISAPVVDALDSTGAGDALCGVLAAALAEGMSVQAALHHGVTAGALAASSHGALAAMPRRADIEAVANRD
jgi:ribokinase